MKRRGNRRYYQRHDVMLIRQIRSLLYQEGYTIGGARQHLAGDAVKDDNAQVQQMMRQLRSELEDVLRIFGRPEADQRIRGIGWQQCYCGLEAILPSRCSPVLDVTVS